MKVMLQLWWNGKDHPRFLRKQLDVDWPCVPRIGDTLALEISAEHDWKVEGVIWQMDGTVDLYLGHLYEGDDGDRTYPGDYLDYLQRLGFAT